MSEIKGKELGWDDEIKKESEFILLPAGEYDFTVINFERARHGGSEKLPPCNKAIVSLKIAFDKGEVTIKNNLFLHSKCEGIRGSFFLSINRFTSLDCMSSPLSVFQFLIPNLHLPIDPGTKDQSIFRGSPCFFCPMLIKNDDSIPSHFECRKRLFLIVTSPLSKGILKEDMF